MEKEKLHEFIHRMPKVELHVHLEGSTRPATLLQLAEKNDVALPVSTLAEIEEWYKFTGFDHFLEVYFMICDCIKTTDDFELIMEEFLKGQAEQNIRYSEVIFTPYTHLKNSPFEEQLAAMNRARAKMKAQYGIEAGLIPDISREMRPVADSMLVAEWAAANQENGIIALGLGGPEVGNPPELYEAVFARALQLGLRSLPHAGETEGPASVWGTINSLRADRIGHGVRCLEDPALVEYLVKHQLPLDVCPTSNICLGVFPSIEEHPLPELMNQGLLVTLNSDDPPMFNTTLTQEYHKAVDVFGFGLPEVKQLVLNGIQASLLPYDRKTQLLSSFLFEFEMLEKVLSR
ncbi:MAG: adenosine deaminase [Anaerolineae bacterium]|jgi:adenosine deaminase|nr:adenosine deaminase [Anaerolineae bacterium]